MNRAKLEEQIGEMEYQLHKMREELNKPKKFEWSYEKDKSYLISTYFIEDNTLGLDTDFLKHGRFRKTRQAAEMSLARNKRANRLEALAEQLGVLKEFVHGEYNHWICFDDKKWQSVFSKGIYYPETVYMTEDGAIEICRMLNAGEFSLDGEI